MIGLICAMPEEADLFEKNIKPKKQYQLATMQFRVGRLNDFDVVLLQSGVGKVSAAIGTQIMINHFPVERIIFTGLAGSLVPNLGVGDIVVSNYVVQYDFDLTAFGRRIGELPNVGRMIEADPRMVKLAYYAFDDIYKYDKNSPELMVGTIVSGDRFISDSNKIERLHREFGAIATEMEGAAVGYTCHVNDIPFVIIRTISDTAGADAKEEFESYLKVASERSFKIVDRILHSLSHIMAVE